ncbi:MAG TPA: hypothetical protein VGK48_20085 [Terriglobia bacterium]
MFCRSVLEHRADLLNHRAVKSGTGRISYTQHWVKLASAAVGRNQPASENRWRVIGKTLTLDDFPYVVAGIAPEVVLPGVVAGVIFTAAFIRLNGEKMGIPLSNVENLAYVAGGGVAILISIAASLAPARRAASVQPMVAMRSE